MTYAIMVLRIMYGPDLTLIAWATWHGGLGFLGTVLVLALVLAGVGADACRYVWTIW